MGVGRRLKPGGAVIIVVLLVLTVLVVVLGAVVKISSGSLQSISGSEQREDAYRAAEAGAKLALLELRNDADWAGFDPAVQSMPGNEATYEVEVFSPGGTDSPDNGVAVPPGLVYIQSTGETSAGARCQVGLMVKANGGVLDFAAVVRGKIDLMNGSVVEARDPATDLTLTSAATVVTNSTEAGSIRLADNARVEGMARPGPGASGSAINIVNQAEATLGYSPLDAEVKIDPVILPMTPDPLRDVRVYENGIEVDGSLLPPGVPLPPGAYGELQVVNQSTLALESGQYIFSSVIVNDSTIQVPLGESVELFSNGPVHISKAALVNDNKTPSTMMLQVTQGDVLLDVSKGAAYFLLNAPNSDVMLINGSKQYGNLIANNLTLQNSSLYYDPSAGGSISSSGSTMPIIKSYQRFDRR